MVCYCVSVLGIRHDLERIARADSKVMLVRLLDNIAIIIGEYGFPYRSHGRVTIYSLLCFGILLLKEDKAKLTGLNVTLIPLIDRVRMLDDDLIRLQQKLDALIELKELKVGNRRRRG